MCDSTKDRTIKGAMVILHGAKSTNNLYRLKKNFMIGGVVVSTEAEGDELFLWHMRLGI